MADEFLIPKEEYLSSGIHIGMKSKTADMKRFIYKIRDDGLSVLNLKLVDERIGIAVKFLAKNKKIIVVGRKTNAQKGVKRFAEVTGADYVVGRFMPGTLTNPNYSRFIEPDVVLLTDPLSDRQALKEAVDSRIPVVALCGTFNETKNIDLVIPCNNKGRKSLGLIFWLLARELMRSRGEKEFKHKVEEFVEESVS
ncbi:MAG: 30S ribosomal protein S2 [Candidatus Aenigmarchaeota archaeon]|nr:30S ribosomal protein S2 [Candidatus Aenigmarchaeota archaeon]